MTATITATEHYCDIDFHPFTGEPMEVRIANYQVPGDMVCVMVTCPDHASEIGGHPQHWWQQWLQGEGAAEGYTTLS